MLLDTPIITSVLDDDKYNFHMGNFFHYFYPNADVSYTYKCRDVGINFAPIYEDIKYQINCLGDLRLTNDEAHYMTKNSFCREEYLYYLTKNQVINPSNVACNLLKDGSLDIRYKGNPDLIIYGEIKTLAIISELYFRNLYKDNYEDILYATNSWIDEQVEWLKNNAHEKLRIVEAGGRRRFSKIRHEHIIKRLWDEAQPFIKGTSNCLIGMKHDIPTFGTQAHQLYMFMQTVTHPAFSQIKALNEWFGFYGPDLAIALSDTLGDSKWDRDFDKNLQIIYSGQRHDSGCPYKWADLRLNRYVENGIDPKTKSLMFGDSLDWKKANDLTSKYSDKTNVSSLIGTFITNSLGKTVPNHKPLSQVIKMTWANGLPTCKTSADVVKAQCECEKYLEYCKVIAAKY
jgi:nicotinate phosphoribosyltransferase